MIRFIDLGDQICEGIQEFAWWDTGTDSFMSFYDSQSWQSVEDFIKDFTAEAKGKNIYEWERELQRHLSLIPKHWPIVPMLSAEHNGVTLPQAIYIGELDLKRLSALISPNEWKTVVTVMDEAYEPVVAKYILATE